MGKNADLRVVRQAVADNIHKKGKPQMESLKLTQDMGNIPCVKWLLNPR